MSSVNSIVRKTARKVIDRSARSQSFKSKSRAALAVAALAGMATAAHSATRYYDTNGTTAQIGNAAGVAAIGAVFFVIEALQSARAGFVVSLALFAVLITICAAFLAWMRLASA